MNVTGHVHGVSALERPEAQVAEDSGRRDQAMRFTAPCLCGCQLRSSASSASGTQLTIVTLPSAACLPMHSIFESNFTISSREPARRALTPDWIPV
jgi:hypothetical protein